MVLWARNDAMVAGAWRFWLALEQRVKLTLQSGDGGAEMERVLEGMLEAARESYAKKQTVKTLETLRAAHGLAAGHGLHRQASVLKRALGILASGSRPKLLTRKEERLADE